MAAGVAAALQIFNDVTDAPGFQAAALGAVEPRREPALHQPAAKGAAAPVGAEQVLGRVAGPATRRARDEISAAIPFRGFPLVRAGSAGPPEQYIPGAPDHAGLQRPAQLR